MARFKLRGPHYLNCLVNGEKVQWEQEEVDQQTQKKLRKRYDVPLMLHPDDPSDWNYITIGPQGKAVSGEIIVTTKEDPAFPRDIVFKGDPTPDMDPLDQDAIDLINMTKHKWIHPIESLSGTFGERIADGFQQQIAALQSQIGAGPLQVIEEMKKRLDALEAENKRLSTQAGSGAAGGTATEGAAGVSARRA